MFQAFIAAQCIIKVWSGNGVPVGQVQAADSNAVYPGFEVTAMEVFRVSGQSPVGFFSGSPAGQDGHAVPAFLPVPDSVISRLADGFFRKFFLRCFQFLQAGNVRLCFLKPAKRSEEHTSELTSLMRISYAVF